MKVKNNRTVGKSRFFFFYLVIGAILAIQLVSTLYTAGTSIGSRSTLAYLERQRQELIEQKFSLTQSLSAQVTLSVAQDYANNQGFIKINKPLAVSTAETLANLVIE